jgi:hypothetical protein
MAGLVGDGGLVSGLRWGRPAFGQAIPPTAVNVTVDRGANATYVVGQPITVCVVAETRVGSDVRDYSPFVRLIDLRSDGSRSILYEGEVPGQYCLQATVTPPAGRETIRAEYVVCGIGGCAVPGVVNAAEVSVNVVHPSTPQLTPTAAPSITATPVGTLIPAPTVTPPEAGAWLDRPPGAGASPACPASDQWLLLYWSGPTRTIYQAVPACPYTDYYWTRRGTTWLGFIAANIRPGINDEFDVAAGEAVFVHGARLR